MKNFVHQDAFEIPALVEHGPIQMDPASRNVGRSQMRTQRPAQVDSNRPAGKLGELQESYFA